ncbi:hypothetical protein MKS88_004902 [Plasmodium brasilianum]|uniref:Uncharacterized protein n=1 Tax=Plasmodium brasilianum TaxID=5824 RepID=A0ACB9Y4K5_PLABR|nr:hypothetical protein MKS88_004902 [Plasmodium brasilianum]
MNRNIIKAIYDLCINGKDNYNLLKYNPSNYLKKKILKHKREKEISKILNSFAKLFSKDNTAMSPLSNISGYYIINKNILLNSNNYRKELHVKCKIFHEPILFLINEYKNEIITKNVCKRERNYRCILNIFEDSIFKKEKSF